MSFSIVLQTTSDDPRKLTKSVSDIATVSGTLKDETSIINPVIRIQYDLSALSRCNYMTISEFNRKYFITDIRSITNNIVEITGHVDVLSTYAAEIRSNTAIIKKQANTFNLYLNDDSLKVYQNPRITTKEFSGGFNTYEFVLAVAGS